MTFIETLHIRTLRQGLHEITNEVQQVLSKVEATQGLCTVFIQHTSASLLIQENADPSARADLEAWMNRHVPERDPHYTHTLEGADDMPAHIKAALTASHLAVPFQNGSLCLGRWQGIYLWEHRKSPHTRTIIVHLS